MTSWSGRGARRPRRTTHARGWLGPAAGACGFTILELVVVLMIGGVLTSVVVGGLGGIQSRLAVRSAQSHFLSMHAQTRALAVERGIPMQLAANADPGVVSIHERCTGAGAIVDSRNFAASHGVELDTGGGALSLCMTPRGFADPNQNSFAQEGRIGFLRGPHARGVVLLPLGQAVRP